MAASPAKQEQSIEPSGRVIPVFCIADIPVKTLNQLLLRDAEHRNEASYWLWFVTDYSDDVLNATEEKHSRAPAQVFSSPCVGMRYQQLNEIFWRKFSGQQDFAVMVFFVMDSPTPEDETLVVVEARDPAGMTEGDNGLDTLRTDFYAARQLAMLSDLGVESLLEGRDHMKVYEGHTLPMDL